MRNPNGYGAIIKLGGKRRKPFAIRLTVGYDDNGKQKFEYLSYHEDRKEAMMALAEYNRNPFELSKGKLSFEEVFKSMMKEKFPEGPSPSEKSNWNGYNASYKACEQLHSMKFIDIRKKELQAAIDGYDRAHGTKRKMKVLFNQMFKYALEHDLVTKDYSQFVDVGKKTNENIHKPFTDDEIKLLWQNVDRDETIELILITIYTGMRPGELVDIKIEDINLSERYLRGGFKTDAGTNRLIPINKKILPFIERRYDPEQKYLIRNTKGGQMSYSNYAREKFAPLMTQLEMDHKPHDGRHTFATLMDNAGANKLAIKRIMGHASKDITDKVYTHKDITQLLAAIDLI